MSFPDNFYGVVQQLPINMKVAGKKVDVVLRFMILVTDGTKDEPRRIYCRNDQGEETTIQMGECIPFGYRGVLKEGYYYPSHQATDFYHHYKEDIALMGEMGFKTYRLSKAMEEYS